MKHIEDRIHFAPLSSKIVIYIFHDLTNWPSTNIWNMPNYSSEWNYAGHIQIEAFNHWYWHFICSQCKLLLHIGNIPFSLFMFMRFRSHSFRCRNIVPILLIISKSMKRYVTKLPYCTDLCKQYFSMISYSQIITWSSLFNKLLNNSIHFSFIVAQN